MVQIVCGHSRRSNSVTLILIFVFICFGTEAWAKGAQQAPTAWSPFYSECGGFVWPWGWLRKPNSDN
jgi:hypothetical protein